MKGGKETKGRNKKGANYEDAMKEAFSEIFQNLKEIERDINLKKQRQKVDFETRRGSAPAAALREETVDFRKPKEEVVRKISTPTPPKSSFTEDISIPSTMQWLLPCWEEEEDI